MLVSAQVLAVATDFMLPLLMLLPCAPSMLQVLAAVFGPHEAARGAVAARPGGEERCVIKCEYAMAAFSTGDLLAAVCPEQQHCWLAQRA